MSSRPTYFCTIFLEQLREEHVIFILRSVARKHVSSQLLFAKLFFWFRDQVFALDFYLCKLMILLKKSLNILTGKLKLWKLPKNSGNVQKILSQHLKNLLVSLLLTNSACVYTPTYGLARISGFLKSGQHSKQCVVVFIVS